MLTITIAEQKNHCPRRTKCWLSLLLLSSALWPFSASACISEPGSFDLFDIFLVVLELALVGFFLLMWWITGKLWPAEPWRSDYFKFYSLFFAAVTSIALGLAGTFYISEFEHMFASFGAELPNATRFIFNNRHFLWLTTSPVAIMWWFFKNKAIHAYYFAILCNIEIGIFIWVLWALYRPIFKMGGVC